MSKDESTETDKAHVRSFESALEELEQLIEEMEAGKIPLDKLIKKFEDGTKLVHLCQQHLKDADLKIEQFKKNLGEMEFEPIDPLEKQ